MILPQCIRHSGKERASEVLLGTLARRAGNDGETSGAVASPDDTNNERAKGSRPASDCTHDSALPMRLARALAREEEQGYEMSSDQAIESLTLNRPEVGVTFRW